MCCLFIDCFLREGEKCLIFLDILDVLHDLCDLKILDVLDLEILDATLIFPFVKPQSLNTSKNKPEHP